MLKREKYIFVLTGFILFLVLFSFMNENSNPNYTTNNQNNTPNTSINLEGTENIIITNVDRKVNISGYGLLVFEDSLMVKNLNNNPISSVFFGIPLDISDKLVFLEASGLDQNTLLIEQSSIVMEGLEMIVAYFNSPLLPQQSRLIKFTHIYKDLINYQIYDDQVFVIGITVYPLLPYRMETNITSEFSLPKTSENIEAGWGFVNPDRNIILFYYELIGETIREDFISPFLENMGDSSSVVLFFSENSESKLEMKEINREIFISPWGIIKVKEEFSLENLGLIDFYSFSFKIPQLARNVYISDQLGEILGVTYENSGNYKNVEIQLLTNRVRLKPNTTFTFKIEYYLPFEHYVSINWFQQSLKIDLLSTNFKYLGRDQTIKIKIDGCYNIESINEAPESIFKSEGATFLIYKSDFVTPLERKILQITFTVDIFNLLLRPIIFILTILLMTIIYVFITKSRKKEVESTLLTREFIPVNEIREFVSLNEEKNALTLEIRQSEDDTKRKKIAKKTYKNILEKNSSKIDEIQKEINPFKKILIDAGETFENIIKRLDLLEAERISVKDSLKLLETRYKRGRLPSRAAYQKLSDDFKKRRRKIDRTIDKLLQQLRSYLL